MRVAWSTLIVLVLLAPFGRVGITATPVEAEVVTMPSEQHAPRASAEAQPDVPTASGGALGLHLVAWMTFVAAYVHPAPSVVASVPLHVAPSIVENVATAAPSARGPPA